MTNRGKITGVTVAAVLLIVLVFFTGILDRQKVWENLAYKTLRFEDNKLRWSLEDGDAYGVHNTGPGLTLPEGTYRLKIRIFCDGRDEIRITCANGARIEPGSIQTDPDVLDQEVFLTVSEAAQNVMFQIDFCDGTYMEFSDIRIYSPMYRDNVFTFSFLIFFIWLLVVLHIRGRLRKEQSLRIVLIGTAILFASAPSLRDNLTMVLDTNFHLCRIQDLASGLASGQFPVRCGGYTYNGWGSVTHVFYPDLWLYPSALLLLSGTTIQYAVHVLEIGMHILAAVSMYVCASHIWKDRDTAAAASILYVLATYRLTDVYTRGAYGEALAMSFLPFFVLGLYEIALGEKEQWHILALGASAIFYSHLLSTVMCAGFAAIFCILCGRRLIHERRLPALGKAILLTGLLCTGQLIPLWEMSRQGIGAADLRGNMAGSALAPAQLLLMGAGDMAVDPKDSTLSGMALEPGFILIVGGVLSLCLCLTSSEEKEKRDNLLFSVLAFVFAMATTTLFPWSIAAKITNGFSDYIQFPWRFMVFPTVLLSLTGGLGYVKLVERKEAALAGVLLLMLFMAVPITSDQTRSNDYLEYGQGANPNLSYREYTLPGTVLSRTKDREVILVGDGEVLSYDKSGTNIIAGISSSEQVTVSFPLFCYDGYAAWYESNEIPVEPGENGRIQVQVPEGTGILQIRYREKGLWRLSEEISLLALILILWRICWRRKQHHASPCMGRQR